MKRLAAFVIALVFLFLVNACGMQEKTTQAVIKEISVVDVLKNPSSYLDQSAMFKSGIAVFKKQKEEASVIVVAPYPLPKIKSIVDLNESDILPIKVKTADYKKVDIGSIVVINGHMETAKANGRAVYYLDARDLIITGHESVDDPDFEKLVKVINEKAKDSDFFDYFSLFIFLFPLLFDD